MKIQINKTIKDTNKWLQKTCEGDFNFDNNDNKIVINTGGTVE